VPDVAVAAALAGERALLDPGVRADPARAGALLHPEFAEVGASGRRWGRAEILAAMADELSLAGERVEVRDLQGERIAEDVVHLTYLSDVAGRVARRSSLWRRTDDGWRLWFHQGTPVSPTAAAGPAGE
jgi:hypothetical protein